MATHDTTDRLLTVTAAARELGVSAATIRRACDAGVLPCHRSPGGHRRIETAALEAISRADLTHEGRARRAEDDDEERAIRDVEKIVAAHNDLRGLSLEIAGRLNEVTGAVDCDIFLRVDEGDADTYRCFVSLERDGEDESVRGYALRPDLYASTRQVLEQHAPLLIGDVGDLDRGDSDRAVLTEYGFVSSLSVPLLVDDRLVGVIDLYADEPEAFGRWLTYVVAAARAAAGPIEKALLFHELERRNRVLSELLDLAGMLSRTYDVDALLRTVATRLLRAVEATHCDIYRREGDGFRCVVSADREGFLASYEGHVLDLGRNPTSAAALRDGRPLVITDVEGSVLGPAEQAVLIEQGLASELCIPLVVGGEPIGMVDLFDTRPRDWQDCADFAAGVGQLIAGGLENARLLGHLEQRNRELDTLVEGGLEFGATLDMERVLLSIARRMRDATGACAVDIHTLQRGVLKVVASVDAGGCPAPKILGLEYLVDDLPLSDEALSRAPVLVEDILSDARASEEERRNWATYGLRSAIIVPLINAGEPVGVAHLFDREPRVFAQVELLRGLGQVAGQAITNARLYEELEQRNREAELLNEIARKTAASLDLAEIAEAAVDGLRTLVAADTCSLTLLHDGRWVTVYDSEPPGGDRQAPAALDAADRMLDKVRSERVVVSGSSPGAGELRGHSPVDGNRASAAIGLFEGDDLVGLLMLGSRSPEAFAGVDASVLERIGVYLSLAAHNARLYEEIKDLHLSNLKGLSTALNAKDYYTLGHAARVAAYIVLLGEELRWDPDSVEMVRDAAYLHDIGKIGVSDRVLLKQGPLNKEEWELMRQHPTVSAEIIRPLFPPDLVAAVRHHHERFDGNGYPDGLAGEQIPELARALCVVDSYDAMSLQRPYRGALTASECDVELERCSGEQFDPRMVAAFKCVLGRLAKLREMARRAAAEAAVRIDPALHGALQQSCTVDDERYKAIQGVLRDVRDAHPEVRFMTTEARLDKACVIVVDAEETGSAEFSPPGEDVMVDDAVRQVLTGQPVVANVLFVDNFGVWVNGLVPLVGHAGEIVAVVAADAPALSSTGTHGFARMTGETPVSTLQAAAVRLSRAEIESITDGLTGLYNHRHLHESLSEHVARARMDDAPLSVLFCDLDFFKDYNDRLGHAAGDSALRATARIIETCTRRADLAARYGGEEFVVLLPGASRPEALAIAGRIRASLAERYAEEGALTISIGVATYPEDAADKRDLLETADRAMYDAKRLGRDRVVAAGS